jgi:hypothetical protein
MGLEQGEGVRTQRDSNGREAAERESIASQTWCSACQKADLGMVSPVEYVEDGQIYVEGRCAVCNAVVNDRNHRHDISD